MNQIVQLGQMAISYINNGNFVAAEKVLKGLLKVKPHDFNALNLCGYVLVIQAKESEAIEYFDKAYAINSKDAGLLHNFGKACVVIGLHEKVIQLYTQLISISGANEEVMVELGLAFFGTGKFKDAIDTYDQVLKYFPQSRLAHINKISALVETRQIEVAL